MIASLLMLSVFLSTLRNILSKNISDINFGTRVFLHPHFFFILLTFHVTNAIIHNMDYSSYYF